MATYFATHNNANSSTVAAATPGKRIRIRRLIVSATLDGTIEFKQDIGGDFEQRLLPELAASAAGPALDLRFERELPQTESGLALGYESAIAGKHGIWIEYDLAD